MDPRSRRLKESGKVRPGTRSRPRSTAATTRPLPKVRPAPGLTVEIISIGRELLRGRTLDTNAHEIAAYLTQRGALVRRITTVDNRDQVITSAVTDALSRGCRLVVTTGGLGPMADDCTLGAVADALKLPLAIHAHAKDMVESAYRQFHEQGLVFSDGLTAAREKMCAIPIGSEPIPNSGGAAPGVLARLPGGTAVLCLPGVPAEMRSVLEAAMPRLKDLAPRGAVARREVETPTADESSLRPLLDRLRREFPSVWIKSHPPGFEEKDARIRVILEASAPDRNQAESLVEDALRRLISLAASG